MQYQIEHNKLKFIHDKKKGHWRLKDGIMQPIEDMLGFKWKYKNYKLLK